MKHLTDVEVYFSSNKNTFYAIYSVNSNKAFLFQVVTIDTRVNSNRATDPYTTHRYIRVIRPGTYIMS